MSREIADKNKTLFPIQVTTKCGPQKRRKEENSSSAEKNMSGLLFPSPHSSLFPYPKQCFQGRPQSKEGHTAFSHFVGKSPSPPPPPTAHNLLSPPFFYSFFFSLPLFSWQWTIFHVGREGALLPPTTLNRLPPSPLFGPVAIPPLHNYE